ncbi:hypothetical protein phiA047_0158 [Aeromonas phage phiA047]|nr:hypothetical protein phiA047_0158 [Aeromonas phage phiA047]
MDNKQNKFLINTDFYSFPILNELSWMKLESMLIFKGQTKIVHVLDRRNPTLYYILQYSKSPNGTFDLSKPIPRGCCFGLGETEYNELIEFVKETDKIAHIFLPTENDLICLEYEEALKELILRSFKDDLLVYNKEYYIGE